MCVDLAKPTDRQWPTSHLQSKLAKFVQINWLGDGVPVSRKGLFHTHASAVAAFLKGTHVVINARNESDVSPSLIMSRVEAASGAKYSSQKETARKFEPIAPVGTNYTPIGKVDIGAIRRDAASKPSPASSMKPSASASSYLPSRPVAPPVVKSGPAPDDDWDTPPAITKAPSLPAASRPPTLPSAARPTPAVSYQLSCTALKFSVISHSTKNPHLWFLQPPLRNPPKKIGSDPSELITPLFPSEGPRNW